MLPFNKFSCFADKFAALSDPLFLERAVVGPSKEFVEAERQVLEFCQKLSDNNVIKVDVIAKKTGLKGPMVLKVFKDLIRSRKALQISNDSIRIGTFSTFEKLAVPQ